MTKLRSPYNVRMHLQRSNTDWHEKVYPKVVADGEFFDTSFIVLEERVQCLFFYLVLVKLPILILWIIFVWKSKLIPYLRLIKKYVKVPSEVAHRANIF